MVELGTCLLKALVGIEDAPRNRVQEIIQTPGKVNEIARSIIATSSAAPLGTCLPAPFKAEETNLAIAIASAERFSKEILGVTVDLRKQFAFPAELPWKDVLVVFDPGLTNREAVKRAIKGQNIVEWEETDVMRYSDSDASKTPTVHIIENSLRPTNDTMGKSPNQLNEDGCLCLTLRGYALAFGLRYFMDKKYLDEQTWTWFPKNRLPDGCVAYGDWDSGDRGVGFGWCDPSSSNPGVGARAAIPVPLFA